MSLEIKPLKTKASKHQSPPAMEAIGIKHPFSMGVFGCSGSGKTVLTCSLLLNKNMFKKYFDFVYLLTPTGGADDSFQQLGLPKDQIITDNFIEELDKIIKEQEAEVESKGVDKANKVCVIFEDLTSLKKLMNSSQFLKAFVQNRHLNMSCIAVCHKYRALNRTARMNCNHHIIFPATRSEMQIIADEMQTANVTKQQFFDLMTYAWTPDKNNKKPFLWINQKVEPVDRYRKNLTQIIRPAKK